MSTDGSRRGPCGEARFADPPRDPAVVPHHSRHRFAVDPGQVWAVIDNVEGFPRLWSWLHDFEADGARLRPGLVMQGTVVAPVPYRLRLVVEIDEVARGRHVRASVHGDLTGPAALELEETAAGCELAVCWRMRMDRPVLRAATRVVRPALVWGHDRVVEATVGRFRRHLDTAG